MNLAATHRRDAMLSCTLFVEIARPPFTLFLQETSRSVTCSAATHASCPRTVPPHRPFTATTHGVPALALSLHLQTSGKLHTPAARALGWRSASSLRATQPLSLSVSSLSTPSAADLRRRAGAAHHRGRAGALLLDPKLVQGCALAAAPPRATQRPRRAIRRASACTSVRALLTRHFRRSTEACARSPPGEATIPGVFDTVRAPSACVAIIMAAGGDALGGSSDPSLAADRPSVGKPPRDGPVYVTPSDRKRSRAGRCYFFVLSSSGGGGGRRAAVRRRRDERSTARARGARRGGPG